MSTEETPVTATYRSVKQDLPKEILNKILDHFLKARKSCTSTTTYYKYLIDYILNDPSLEIYHDALNKHIKNIISSIFKPYLNNRKIRSLTLAETDEIVQKMREDIEEGVLKRSIHMEVPCVEEVFIENPISPPTSSNSDSLTKNYFVEKIIIEQQSSSDSRHNHRISFEDYKNSEGYHFRGCAHAYPSMYLRSYPEAMNSKEVSPFAPIFSNLAFRTIFVKLPKAPVISVPVAIDDSMSFRVLLRALKLDPELRNLWPQENGILISISEVDAYFSHQVAKGEVLPGEEPIHEISIEKLFTVCSSPDKALHLVFNSDYGSRLAIMNYI